MFRRLMFAAALAAAAPAVAQPLPVGPPLKSEGAAKPEPAPAQPAAACPPAIEVKLPEPPPKPQADPQTRAIADGFFRSLQAGQADKAYRDIWRGTPMMERKPVEVQAVIDQTAAALQLYGRIDRWEPMTDDLTSPSFITLTYLVAADVGPLFFRLQFYKKPAGWTVYRIDFADRVGKLPA